MDAPSLLVCIALASVALLAQPATTQFSYPARVLQADSCPSNDQRERTRSDINGDLDRLLQDVVVPPLMPCGGLGWRQIVYINTTENDQSCPSGWNRTPVNSGSIILCRANGVGTLTFDTVMFNTGLIPYDQVCGRMTAYQFGSTAAFSQRNTGINTAYVDGASITHGLPPARQHIWSFAIGRAEITALDSDSICPCSLNSTNSVPAFVGNNYFCDTGTIIYDGNILYLDDPLWDGQGCGPSSNCCSFNSPPWFNVRLPNATTDDIEVRIGVDSSRSAKDTYIESIVIYVR